LGLQKYVSFITLLWIVLGILVILVGLYKENLKELEGSGLKQTRKLLLTNFALVLIGGSIIFLGVHRENLHREKNEQQQSEIISLQQNIINTQDKIIAKSEEITELNKRSANLITGGDSYCFLGVSNLTTMGDYPLRLAVHMGKYPLYDVQVEIADLDKFAKLLKSGKHSYEDVMNTYETFKIGNLNPRQLLSLGHWNLKDADNIKKYNVFIIAKNGKVDQNIVLKKINGHWKLATRVFKQANHKRKILYEIIDSALSKDDIGWD
jgi:hypothetical protein